VTLPGGWAFAVMGMMVRQKMAASKVHRVMIDFEYFFGFFPLHLIAYLLKVFFPTD
jgi:hypothetical protein